MEGPPPPFEQVVSFSDPITLTWTPTNLDGNVLDESATGDSSSSNPATVHNQPLENPPEYATASRPTKPILYSFSPISLSNAMLLIPPSDAQDTRPLYYISVSLNCFNPLSAITSIRRGATEYGDYVGDFEMGISPTPGTVYFRNKEFLINSLITKLGSRQHCVWKWLSNSSTHAVTWDTRPIPAICTAGLPSDPPLAKFYRAEGHRRPSEPAPMSRLEVMPHGHERLDDILISLLIIERKRLIPRNPDHKVLFS